MSAIAKLRKDELKLVAEELGLEFSKDAKIVELKELIENSEIYVTDIDTVKGVIDYVLEGKQQKQSEAKLELEKIQIQSEVKLELERLKLAQLERELEIANLRKEASENGAQSTSVSIDYEKNELENLIKSVKTLSIPVPSRAESFSLFFQSLEKAFKTKSVPEGLRSEILLNILGERANNLLVYVSEEELGSYERLKEIVLKEFQPTPQECLNNFQKAQKLASESYVQFSSRMSAAFGHYCQLRKVDDFKSLCELIISDKIYATLERDLMSHIAVKQGEGFFKPQELGRECDLFLSTKIKGKFEANMGSKLLGNDTRRYEGTKFQRSQNPRFQKKSNVFLSEVKSDRCSLCRGNETHPLTLCSRFKNLSVRERVETAKTHKVCFKCLSPGCSVRSCSARNCFCGKPHHKMLHFPRDQITSVPSLAGASGASHDPQPQSAVAENARLVNSAPFYPSSENPSVVATSFAKGVRNVLLSTVRVLVKNRLGEWEEVRCLLDNGAEVCLVSAECAKRLQLRSEQIRATISCLNDSSMVVNGRVTTTISNNDKSFQRELNLLVVKKITELIPHQVLNVEVEVSELVPLADHSFNVPGKIDMLLGAEIFFELLRPGQIYAQNSRLLLQNTVFGYVASGSVDSAGQASETRVHCGLVREEDLNQTLLRFWEIESVEGEITKGKEHAICEEHFMRTHYRNADGKYVVSMPLKDDPSCLGNSRDSALKRLKALWNRLSRDPEYLTLYREFLEEYKRLGHMREVVEEREPDVAYYATHHGVYRPEKSSTKLRVVFNCSALTENGNSLNSLQYNGGVIQQDLFSIMVRFRQHTYVLTADVKMMYRMILIDPNQHQLQRILWSDGPNEVPKTYELLTVTYGTVSAPYLAMRTLQQLATDEQREFPIAAPVVREDFYMDDVLSGASTLEAAKELQSQLVGIMQKAGMQLHKWSANHSELTPDPGEYNFSSPTETRTLGVLFKPKEDCFSFKVKVKLCASYTKRSVLSTIARLFDPLGLLGPVVARAKIFMQRLWRLEIDWNGLLPDAELHEWHEFLMALEHINGIEIQRHIVVEEAIVVEIHGFADASERCYGAVVYCKSENTSGKVEVRLVASKSRVAPVKSLTIPRLELCAAVLLASLVKKVLLALKLKVKKVFLWSDSTIVLSWLRKEPMDLKTFVQNRVARIQELSSVEQWHHVPSEQNPADLLSRGLSADKLLDSELWWKGPEFLLNKDYPGKIVELTANCQEFKSELKKDSSVEQMSNCLVSILANDGLVNNILNSCNNLLHILRVFSYIFRFILNARHPRDKKVGPLGVEELDQAETFLIKAMQGQEFPAEVKALSKNESIPSTSKLKGLCPFLDKEGIIRVGGRLQNSDLDFCGKHPILLPAKHRLSTLIVKYIHEKGFHVGPQSLLYSVREKYWPISGRALCRKICHECIVCFRANPVASEQIMSSLPSERVTRNVVFGVTGIDFCGPFLVKYKNQRKGVYNKVYVAIFICLATRAVHLEIVTDLTCQAFIACLKRFFSRRGKPIKIFSDNGKTFSGTNNELKRLQNLVVFPDELLSGYLSAERVEWKFIPPRAPNFGGLWEAGVKSFKFHFKRIVGNATLTLEEFLTIVVQIEGFLNSRPLYPMSSDPNDFHVLSPGHFLIGRPISAVVEPSLCDIAENRLTQWQRITKFSEQIWKRWSHDYLNNLQQRSKWMFEKNNVKPGSVVLIKEENLPSTKWLVARVIEAFPGRDGKIRVVKLLLPDGNCLTRSVRHICVLPTE